MFEYVKYKKRLYCLCLLRGDHTTAQKIIGQLNDILRGKYDTV